MNLSIPSNTWICLFIIGLAFLGSLVYVLILQRKDNVISSRRIVEYLPSLVSTLGVLGTFYGITIGLMHFDTADLDKSIPGLLDGLKTAFFTSLAGMIGSVALSFFINRIQDKKEKGVSDINQAASTICQSVQQMSEANRETLNGLKAMFEEQENDRKAFYRSLGDSMDRIKEHQQAAVATMDQIKDSQSRVAAAIDTMVILTRSQEGSLANIKANQLTVVSSLNSIKESQTRTVSTLDSMIEIARTQEGSLADINDNVSGTTSIIDRLADNSNMQLNALNDIVSNNSQISEINRNVGEVLDVVSSISSIEESINSEVMKFKDIIDAEVGQVEESMDKTNKLLERKFDEFTELLKKSNTEALVEVMKKVTEEFQKQMNSLISKLIQENFEQLNTSVERLNTWQQENKEMIASLTSQYKEMSENFEETSTSLSKVKEDTTSLVGAGGKLHQIVDALNKVIVEDERFLDITKKLQDTANLSKENMEKFENSTRVLNEWVRKQRNFVDGVQSLIEKLDELNKIRDYGEQFWKSTKEKMEEGVNIISNGTNTLNTQLRNIDRSFYERLGTTLGELDNCIAKMVESLENRNHR